MDAVIAPCSLCSKPYVKPPSLVVWEYGIGRKTMDKVNVSMGDIVINRLSEWRKQWLEEWFSSRPADLPEWWFSSRGIFVTFVCPLVHKNERPKDSSIGVCSLPCARKWSWLIRNDWKFERTPLHTLKKNSLVHDAKLSFIKKKEKEFSNLLHSSL